MSLKVTVIAIGKQKRSPEQELWQEYLKRSKWPVQLIELDTSHKEKEGEQLLKATPKGAKIIALDERGKTLSSPELAQWLALAEREAQPLAIVIGGPDGLSETVRKAAHLLLSFGKLTWPHMLVRPMLAEQLYRAQTILSGHPYHRV